MIKKCLQGLEADQELKLRKSVLLVGGNALIPHLAQSLNEKLIDSGFECDFVGGRDALDPRQIAWKGGAVMSRLECINEAGWISLAEWSSKGLKSCHEKFIFIK